MRTTLFAFALAAAAAVGIVSFVFVSGVGAAAAAAAPREPETLPVQRLIAETLGRLPLVGIGELHGNEDVHEVILSLVRDERVASLADDLVVEFGNARHQKVVDRFVAGEDIAIERVRVAWRDTVNPLTWDSPVYERFFRAVREANARRRGGRQVRVVLGDVPVDWQAVRAMADLGPLGSRGTHFASVVEREVLSKDRRAILIAGEWHLFKRNPSVEDSATTPEEERTAAEILLRRHPGKLLVIQPVDFRRTSAAALEEPMRDWPAGTAWAVKGTALGGMEFGVVSPFGDKVRYVKGERIDLPEDTPFRWPKVDEVLDAYLWLGPKKAWRFAKPSAETYEDDRYLAELRRRAKLMGYPPQHFNAVTGKTLD